MVADTVAAGMIACVAVAAAAVTPVRTQNLPVAFVERKQWLVAAAAEETSLRHHPRRAY